MSPAVTASLNECALLAGYRRAATKRLRSAKRLMRRAQNRRGPIHSLAQRELECAIAEAQEWGVAGRTEGVR